MRNHKTTWNGTTFSVDFATARGDTIEFKNDSNVQIKITFPSDLVKDGNAHVSAITVPENGRSKTVTVDPKATTLPIKGDFVKESQAGIDPITGTITVSG